MRSVRVTVIAAFVAALGWCGAAHAAGGPLVDAANDMRAAAGLPPVAGHDPDVEAAARAQMRDPDQWAEMLWARAKGISITGRTGRFGYADGDASATPGAFFAQAPDAHAMVLDPRAVTLDEVTEGRARALVVTVDPSVAWTDPVVVRDRVDVLAGQRPQFVLAPGTEEVDLQLYQRGRWRTITGSMMLVQGDWFYEAYTGAGLLTVAESWLVDGGGFPFDARLRLLVDGSAGPREVRTMPAPARLTRRGLRFERDVTSRQRAAVRAAVRKARPAARRLIGRVAGFTTVGIMPARDASGIGRAGPDDNGGWRVDVKAVTLDGPAGPRDSTVLHELGHVVQMSGIRGGALRRLDRTIPRGGRCPAYDPERPVLTVTGPCATTVERIADTFAKWALGVRRLPDVGYDVATPRSFGAFARIVTREFDYRPSGPYGR